MKLGNFSSEELVGPPRNSHTVAVVSSSCSYRQLLLQVLGRVGAETYKYIHTGKYHYSLAFCYDWIGSERERRSSMWIHDELRPEDRSAKILFGARSIPGRIPFSPLMDLPTEDLHDAP